MRSSCGHRTSLACAGKRPWNDDSMYKSRGINRYQPDIWRLVREIATRRACRCTSKTCTSRTSPFCRKCGQAALTAARMAPADGRPVQTGIALLPGVDEYQIVTLRYGERSSALFLFGQLTYLYTDKSRFPVEIQIKVENIFSFFTN